MDESVCFCHQWMAMRKLVNIWCTRVSDFGPYTSVYWDIILVFNSLMAHNVWISTYVFATCYSLWSSICSCIFSYLFLCATMFYSFFIWGCKYYQICSIELLYPRLSWPLSILRVFEKDKVFVVSSSSMEALLFSVLHYTTNLDFIFSTSLIPICKLISCLLSLTLIFRVFFNL